MNTLKKIALVLSVALPLFGAAGVMIRQQASVDPQEDQLKLVLVPHAQIATAIYADLGDTGELFAEMPAWTKGTIPAFDSRWTPDQFQAALGRSLTADESNLITHLAGLPYGFRTVAAQVGASVSSVASTTRIVEMYGNSGTPFVPSAGFTSSILPDVDWTSVSGSTSPSPKR